MNYTLTKNDEGIFIYVPSLKKQFYTDYNKGLYDILESGIFTSATYGGKKGNIYLKLAYNKSTSYVYFHHIVFCYYYRGLNMENYDEVFTAFREELKNKNLQIDHLIEDKCNNTKANLSLIGDADNRGKRTMKNIIKRTMDYIESYDGNGYRVQFTYISRFPRKKIGSRIRTEHLYCNSISELRELRNYLRKETGWNQWRIKNHCAGVLDSSNMYSVSGEYSLLKPFPELVRNYDTHIMQRYINGLPRDKFIYSDVFIRNFESNEC